MYQRGRPADHVFDPREELYRRIRSQDYVEGSGLYVPFPVFSVNRQKYSEPGDVLFSFGPEWGAVSFVVSAIPSPLESEGEDHVICSFEVMHVPMEDNYAHSEVHTLKGDIRNPKKIPDTVKKKFRQILGERCRLLRLP